MPSYAAYRVITDCFLKAVPQTVLQLAIFANATALVSQRSVTLSIAVSLYVILKNAVQIKMEASSFNLKVGSTSSLRLALHPSQPPMGPQKRPSGRSQPGTVTEPCTEHTCSRATVRGSHRAGIAGHAV